MMSDQEFNAVLEKFERYNDSIFVRELIDGRWKTVSLDELPGKIAIKHVCRLLRQAINIQFASFHGEEKL